MFYFSILIIFTFLVLSESAEECPSFQDTGETIVLASLDTCKGDLGNIYHLDIRLNETHYKQKVKICYNYDSYITYWSQHQLEPSTEECTSVKTQWINKFFDNSDLDSFYGSVSSYATRGHLVPPCDFPDELSRKSTFYYMNAVPFYTNFYQGNWRELEEAIRLMVNSNNLKAKVTTGTFGTQCVVGRVLHIPEQIFKIVAFEDGSSQLFIGVNSDSDDFEDICEAVPGFGWPDVKKGRIYECAINDIVLKKLGVDADAIKF